MKRKLSLFFTNFTAKGKNLLSKEAAEEENKTEYEEIIRHEFPDEEAGPTSFEYFWGGLPIMDLWQIQE